MKSKEEVWIIWISQVAFGVLGFLSVYYAPERLCHADSAWQFWDRVNYAHFVFPSNRYGVFISEIPLYFAVKIGLPFKALVCVFSFSYVLLYYFVWRLCVYVLHSPITGLTILLGLCTGMRQSFCHTVTETHQCLVYCSLLFAILDSNSFVKEYWRRLLAIMITILCLTTHPVAAFPILFITGLIAIRKNVFINPLLISIVIVVIAVAIYRFTFPNSTYDAEQYGGLKDLSDFSFHPRKLVSLWFLLSRIPYLYFVPALLGIAAIWQLIKNRIIPYLALFLLGFGGYMVISIVAFRNGNSDIMMEKNFLPGLFMLNLMFSVLFFKNTSTQELKKILFVSSIITLGIVVIISGCNLFEKRNALLITLMKGKPQKTWMSQSVEMDKLLMTSWGLGVESLLLSKWEKDTCKTVFYYIPNSTFDPNSNCFKPVDWLCLPQKELNSRYFTLPEIHYLENENSKQALN